MQNRIIIIGQTPSHKNSKRMFIARNTGKFFPANNDKYLVWKDAAIVAIKNSHVKFTEPVALAVTFFMGDRRSRDLDNMLASVQDALVSAGAIIDDDDHFLPMVFAKSGGYDPANPRVEITFFRVAWNRDMQDWSVDKSITDWI